MATPTPIPMSIQTSIPLLDEILGEWKSQIGADFTAYKNHVYRMVHFCFALHECSEEDQRKVIIAGCFHDIGIWSDGTIDYLPPSVVQARQYLKRENLDAWSSEIDSMIDLHHKLRAYKATDGELIEAFRKADLVDVSLGAVKFGLPGVFVKSVKTQFPNAGFHKKLGQLAGGWFKRHPVSPPPFIKW